MYQTHILKPTWWKESRFMLVDLATCNFQSVSGVILYIFILLSLELLLVQCFCWNQSVFCECCLPRAAHQNLILGGISLLAHLLVPAFSLLPAPVSFARFPGSSEGNQMITLLWVQPSGESLPGSVDSALPSPRPVLPVCIPQTHGCCLFPKVLVTFWNLVQSVDPFVVFFFFFPF